MVTTYSLNGKPSSSDGIRNCSDSVSINDDANHEVVHGFSTTEKFHEWVAASRYAGEFRKIFDDIRKEQRHQDDNQDDRKASLIAEQKRLTAAMEALAKELSLPLASPALLQKAADRRILQSYALFDALAQKGSLIVWGGIGWAFPDYRWYSAFADNAARSAVYHGIHGFFADYWWKGTSWWVITPPFVTPAVDVPANMDRRISSSW